MAHNFFLGVDLFTVCLYPQTGVYLETENCCVPAFGEAHQWAQAHFFVARPSGVTAIRQ